MRPVCILRPEPGNGLTAQRAEAEGLTVIRLPLFEMVSLDWDAPAADRFDGLLLTSANAVRCAGDGIAAYRDLPVFAVGDATARAAKAAGLLIDAVGDGGIEELLALVPSDTRLLHLCGRDRRAVQDAAQTIVALPVYASLQAEPDGLEQLEHSVAFVHSPRAGRTLARLAADAGLDKGTIRIAAISEAAAEDCGGDWQDIVVSDTPDDRKLVTLAKRLVRDDEP